MPLPEPCADTPIAETERASAAQIGAGGGGWDPYVVWYERVRKPRREELDARAMNRRPSSDLATT
jgi:hypothetical protein